MGQNYIDFQSLEEAMSFGRKYYGDWLPNHHIGGKYYLYYSIDEVFYQMIMAQEGKAAADKATQECLVYETFSYYCGGNYSKAINELCRMGSTTYTFNMETLKFMIQVMDSELERYTIKENIVAYRTLDYKDLLQAQMLNKIRKGDIIIDYGYMGVGLLRSSLLQAQSSYDTAMKIYIPAGCHALYLDLISNRHNEQELLLKRGIRLKVLSNRKPLFSDKREMECIVVV